MTDTDPYSSGALIGVEARLIGLFSPPLRPEHVQRCLLDAVASMATARVETYLPVLIERAATDRLRMEVAQRRTCLDDSNQSSSTRVHVTTRPSGR